MSSLSPPIDYSGQPPKLQHKGIQKWKHYNLQEVKTATESDTKIIANDLSTLKLVLNLKEKRKQNLALNMKICFMLILMLGKCHPIDKKYILKKDTKVGVNPLFCSSGMCLYSQ